MGKLKERMKNCLREFLGIEKLEKTFSEASISNKRAIEFLLDNTKISMTKKDFMDKYQYSKYADMPWYHKRLFNRLYNTKELYLAPILWEDNDIYNHIAYKNTSKIIASERDFVGQIVDKINLEDKK